VGGVVVNGPDYSAGISEGYWPGVYRVPIINGGLRDASLNVDPTRLADRQQLHQSFDRLRRAVDTSGSMQTRDAFDRQAVEVLTSGKAREAFDLSQEDPRLREKYGDGYGQEVLTARRLVEAGVSFVTVCDRGNGPGSAAHNWDDHAVNWDLLTAMNARLPRYDQIVTTLIQDLYDRGLNQRVLLIVTGEFGRTPRLEHKDGRIGRDHWPSAMSILVSGGGMPMGQAIGHRPPRVAPSDRRLTRTICQPPCIAIWESTIEAGRRPVACLSAHQRRADAELFRSPAHPPSPFRLLNLQPELFSAALRRNRCAYAPACAAGLVQRTAMVGAGACCRGLSPRQY
jgi:hypothetical protein